MKKVLVAMMTLSALSMAVVNAAPQTKFEEGYWQANLGVWNASGDLKSVMDDAHLDGKTTANFEAGVSYGLTDKVGIEYNYRDLGGKFTMPKMPRPIPAIAPVPAQPGAVMPPQPGAGIPVPPPAVPHAAPAVEQSVMNARSHEFNAVYAVNNHLSLLAGVNYMSFDRFKSITAFQVGVRGMYPVHDMVDAYGEFVVGTDKVGALELGAQYNVNEDISINLGYRHGKVEVTSPEDMDGKHKLTFNGFVLGASYKFSK